MPQVQVYQRPTASYSLFSLNTDFCSRWGYDIVTVKVGENEETIRARSSFSEKVLSGDWKENKEKTVLLPAEDPAAFAVYKDFLSSDLIFHEYLDDIGYDQILTLGPAYVLGDILLDLDFKDAIIDTIFSDVKRNKMYPFELNRFAFENTPADWPLQRFLTDLLAVYGHSILPSVENKDLLTGEAFFETLKMVYQNQGKARNTSKLLKQRLCGEYHCHIENNIKCYREDFGLQLSIRISDAKGQKKNAGKEILDGATTTPDGSPPTPKTQAQLQILRPYPVSVPRFSYNSFGDLQ